MDSITKRKCVLIGLPNSGKTTYAGALWYLLSSNEIQCDLTLINEPENREYLNKLREAWLTFTPPGRTNAGNYESIDLDIAITGSTDIFQLSFPDVHGEMYESQFEHRVLSSDYVSLISDCEGILLFVNPQFVIDPTLITEVDVVAGFEEPLIEENNSEDAICEKDVSQAMDEDPTSRVENQWKSKLSQSQVILIDTLQMMEPFLTKPSKIALIISAWDIVLENDTDRSPAEWLRKRLPLLNQYLRTNSDIFQHEVFGISAQGGSYAKGKVEQLYNIPLSSERVLVQQKSEVGKDITSPIKWLLND